MLPKLPKTRRSGAFLLPVIDFISLVAAFLSSLIMLLLQLDWDLNMFSRWWHEHGIFQSYAFFPFALIAVQAFWIGGHYVRRKPFWTETREVVHMLILWMLLNGVLILLTKRPFSRTLWITSWSLSLFFVPLGRLFLKKILLMLGRWQRPTLIIGSGERAKNAHDALLSEPFLGFTILGYVSISNEQTLHYQDETPVFHVHEQDILTWLETHPRTHIVIALEDAMLKKHENFIAQLSFKRPSLHVAPNTQSLPLASMESEHFFSHDVLLLRGRNNLLNPSARFIKRISDLFGASLLLLLFSPFFLVVSLLIKQEGGSIFFRQTRVGKHGKLFTCFKFRSMHENAEQLLKDMLEQHPDIRAEYEHFRKLKVDPRITKIGAFLRKTSLDELPQLFNVLRGEMSLVGPRPILPDEIELFGNKLPFYLEVPPGMTGLWQVSGRNRLSFARRVEMDVWYVRNWSLWYDLAILFKTIRVVLKREGAY